MIVAQTAAERDALIELLNPDVPAMLRAVDLAQNLIVAVIRSSQPSSGYLVNVTRILMDENTAYVYVEFSQPRPDRGVAPAVTQPYQIVQVPHSALPEGEIEWILVSYPIYTRDLLADWYPPPSPLATPTDVPGLPIAFDSVLSGYDSRFAGEAAHLLTAETEAELQDFAELIHGDDAQAALAAVDIDEHLLVGVFLPPRDRSGHALAITRILVRENRATVYAEIWEPQPPHPFFFSPAQLHLYRIVRVPRASLPEGEIEWRLVTYPSYVYPPWLD